MKNDTLLTITSLLAIALAALHISDDVVRGVEPAAGFPFVRGMITLSVWLLAVGAATARESVAVEELPAGEPREVRLDLEPDASVQPAVDCSDGRPDRDCLSGRLGADMAAQTCNGVATIFSAGNCSVHCTDGFYACGKCGFGGFAMCTCRQNFTCNPNAP